MKDTLRLILFLECNMSCSYCCNDNEINSKQFVQKSFEEIDFTQYKNVCLTGGEPFLNRDMLYSSLLRIPSDKNVYIYTNGTKMLTKDASTIDFINSWRNDFIKGINIGVHTLDQLRAVPLVESVIGKIIRFKINKFLFPTIMKKKYFGWRMNQEQQIYHGFKVEPFIVKDNCSMPNEDWVLLKKI